jgi:hypothetical protein
MASARVAANPISPPTHSHSDQNDTQRGFIDLRAILFGNYIPGGSGKQGKYVVEGMVKGLVGGRGETKTILVQTHQRQRRASYQPGPEAEWRLDKA